MPGRSANATEAQQWLAELNATLGDWYPGLDPEKVFPDWSPLRASVPFIPPLSAATEAFVNEDTLDAYVKSDKYATGNGNYAVSACVCTCFM